MPRLVYPVVVREIGNAIGATVPDFRWQLVGADAADAIANAEIAVKKELEKCERLGAPPPTPSRVTLAHIEFLDYRGPLPMSMLRRTNRS